MSVHSRSEELQRIVRINEQIKSVVRPAFRINVMALNAIMLARRAGDAARGFGVLSDELRRFSGELSQQMTGLRTLTSASVATVTELIKKARYLAITERMQTRIDGIEQTVMKVCERQRAQVSMRADALHQTQRELRRLVVDDILPLMQLGTVLARSAHIEAAYGGRFATELGQVSSEFSHTIDEIEAALTALHKLTHH